MTPDRIAELVREAASATPEERRQLAEAIANLPTEAERAQRILAALERIAVEDRAIREELAAMGYEWTKYDLSVVPRVVMDALPGQVESSPYLWNSESVIDSKESRINGLRVRCQVDPRPATDAERKAAPVPVEPREPEPAAPAPRGGLLEVN